MSLCLKFSQCLHIIRQSTSRSSLMSMIFPILPLPPILLLSPLKFLPMILNIPSCLVLGAVPCVCSRPSFIASMTFLCLSVAVLDALLASNSTLSLISLMMSSSCSSCNLPCFLNLSSLFHSCSIIVLCGVVCNFPFYIKKFSFTHVDNNWCYLLVASLLLHVGACCWSLLCLKAPHPLNNLHCACAVSPPTDVEERLVGTICPPAPRRHHQQNQRQ